MDTDSHYIFPNLVQNASQPDADYHPAAKGSFTDYLRAIHNNVDLTGAPIDQMRPKLNWIDKNFVPVQPPTSILAPWWPQANNVTDWLTGPPGRPQATDDPAYQRRLEGTIPYPSVRRATEDERYNALLNNAPWLSNLLSR
jgi:hypothetical protein